MYAQTLHLSLQNEQAGGTGQTDYAFQVSVLKTDADYEAQQPLYAGGIITIRADSDSSNTEKYPIGISFVDTTIDPQNPQKVYRLKDFALKTDIPISVDLTNYQGDWKLSNPKTPDSISTGNNYGATNVSIETIDLATDVEPEHRPQAILIRSCQSSQPETTPINDSGIYVNYAGSSLYQVIDEGSIFNLINNSYTGYAQRTYAGRMTCEEYQTGQTPKTIAFIYTSPTGIIFEDTSIQENEFTLKSLVDRIVALESKVTELETVLANKANVNSPSFTGKVTINPITE